MHCVTRDNCKVNNEYYVNNMNMNSVIYVNVFFIELLVVGLQRRLAGFGQARESGCVWRTFWFR